MGYVCDDDDDYRSILDVSADLILSPEPVIEEAMAFGYHLLTIIYRFYGITSYSPQYYYHYHCFIYFVMCRKRSY